jgi:hypothetical protein
LRDWQTTPFFPASRLPITRFARWCCILTFGPLGRSASSNNLPIVHKIRLGTSRLALRMNMRNVVAAVSAIIIIVFLCSSNSFLATSVRSMVGASPQKQPTNPHPSSSTLSLSISEKSPATTPPTILVTATNLHQSTSITLLTWDTPFDEKALLLGIFRFIDASTNEALPSPGLKINRGLPPPRDAFLEVGPRHAITKEFVLDGPGVRLEKGKEYDVQAKGRWKAVWHASVLDIGDENLKKMGGGTGVNTWDFETELLKIKT